MTESYRTIGVATAFSPRFEQVLSEAKRMRDRFDAQLAIIYVGKETPEVAEKFSAALRHLSLPADSPIFYEEGEPAPGILRAIRSHRIDLIVAGALEKEVVLHPFLGNVARHLLREGSSSVMLFTQPARTPQPFNKIVFITDYSEHSRHALLRTLRLAQQDNSQCLYVVRVTTTFDEARARETGKEPIASEEETRLEQFVLELGPTEVPIEVRSVRGNTGFAAADFVKSVEADLLAVPVDPSKNHGRLPANLEWLTDVIPCNLWLIR